MAIALYCAAGLLAFVAIAHSYLGERYLLSRLSSRGDLPKVFRNPELVFRIMRLAWHVTSLAWLGFAAIVLLLARPPVTAEGIGTAVGVTFLVHSAASLIVARGRHLSWVLFLAVGVLVLYAVHT